MGQELFFMPLRQSKTERGIFLEQRWDRCSNAAKDEANMQGEKNTSFSRDVETRNAAPHSPALIFSSIVFPFETISKSAEKKSPQADCFFLLFSCARLFRASERARRAKISNFLWLSRLSSLFFPTQTKKRKKTVLLCLTKRAST